MCAVPTVSDRLHDLAPELLELVLSYLKPHDIASFGRTCQRARAFVHPTNKLLWRSAFLHIFYDPQNAWDLLLPTARAENRPRESAWDWFRELRRRYTAFNVVYEAANGPFLASPKLVVASLLDVCDTASYSKVAGTESRVSLNMDFMDRLFRIAPKAEQIVHDYHRDIESMSLPAEFHHDDRPFTRSMLNQTCIVPEWASRFHVSLLQLLARDHQK